MNILICSLIPILYTYTNTCIFMLLSKNIHCLSEILSVLYLLIWNTGCPIFYVNPTYGWLKKYHCCIWKYFFPFCGLFRLLITCLLKWSIRPIKTWYYFANERGWIYSYANSTRWYQWEAWGCSHSRPQSCWMLPEIQWARCDQPLIGLWQV